MKAHAEYVAEIIGGIKEVHCSAPGCESIMPIESVDHVDLRQVRNCPTWNHLTLASMEAGKMFFCEEHKRLLAKSCPGLRFMALDRTVQNLAQNRRQQDEAAEQRAAEEARRQAQIAAEQAKIRAMQDFGIALFDPEAGGPKEVATTQSSCRLQVLDNDKAARLRQKMAG